MIIIKSEHEIDLMRTSCKVTGEILRKLESFIKPGMSTYELDKIVEDFFLSHNMKPGFKGYSGFPATCCISINDEIVHGIPKKDRILQEGDIVSVDTGCIYKGYYSDAARTYGVGKISKDVEKLIKVTKDSFFEGMKFCKLGYRISDISHAIQEKAESEGFSVIRDFVGHGIGRNMHEEPQIPNYGKAGRGPRLEKGMAFAVEPMICQGDYETDVLMDNWTVVTADGKLSSHYENTLVITDGEPEILTL